MRPGALGAVEQTVTGLGYDLVDVERLAGGLLRVTIDRVPRRVYPGSDSEFVTVDDCERVSRQLQYALEVEGIDYARLEVSSPGLDRPLRRESDYARFAGHAVGVTLRQPFQGRKSWKGVLQPRDGGWNLLFDDGKGEQVLGFTFDEVREARLVPVIDFKGRTKRKPAAAPGAAAQPAGNDGGQ
jgi:ribosome maturation factor RimP